MISHADRTMKSLLLLLVIGVWGLLLYPLFGAAPARAQGGPGDIPVPVEVTAAGETLYIVYFSNEGTLQMKAYRSELSGDTGLTIRESLPRDLP